jgi:hypothetical protein
MLVVVCRYGSGDTVLEGLESEHERRGKGFGPIRSRCRRGSGGNNASSLSRHLSPLLDTSPRTARPGTTALQKARDFLGSDNSAESVQFTKLFPAFLSVGGYGMLDEEQRRRMS